MFLEKTLTRSTLPPQPNFSHIKFPFPEISNTEQDLASQVSRYSYNTAEETTVSNVDKDLKYVQNYGGKSLASKKW